MKNDILVSVIMPALNAEKTIETALVSIRRQTINQDSIEILVIDGGSVDKTREIAAKYAARVVENPEVVPEAAKRIGLQIAQGKYAMWLDTDEELASSDQLEKRIALFRSVPEVKTILLDGYITPDNYPSISTYINSYGDPFSFFIYGYDAANMIRSLQKYPSDISDSCALFRFTDREIIPIGDGGSTMFDLDYARSQFGDKLYTQEFAVTIFQQIVAKTGCVGIVPGDRIIHYATSTIRTFLNKLRFRVITNIYSLPGYGFAARSRLNHAIQKRKTLYMLYCIIFPWPIWDGLQMSITKKNFGMMIHVVLTYYILINVLFYYGLRVFGFRATTSSYGK